jgi:hypothetical protein
MNQHFAIVGGQQAGQRLLLMRDHAGQLSVLSSGSASLQGLVASAVEMMRADPNAEFSFTTQQLSEAFPLCERAGELERQAPGASISLLAPERSDDNGNTLWNSAWRCPVTGTITSEGKAARFRAPAGLAEAINKWFAREDLRSFDPPSPWTAARELQFPVHRPPHHRMLLVRHDWRIRDLVPVAFASPEQEAARLASLEKTQSQFEALRKARDPREKTRLMQEQQALERRLLPGSGANAEERAALELGRKIAAGAQWAEPNRG